MTNCLDSVLVETLMTRSQVSVQGEESLHVADAFMSARGLQHLPVVDAEGNLLGLVSHRDIVAAGLGTVHLESPKGRGPASRRKAERQAREWSVASIMTTEVASLTAEMSARAAAEHLLASRHGFAPVLKGNQLVGVLTEDDILRLCMHYFRSVPMCVADLMTRELVTTRRGTLVPIAMVIIEQEDIHHLLIIDAHGQLEGVVSHRDLLMLQRSVSESAPLDRWTVGQLASKNAWTTTLETSATEAAQTLIDNHFGCLPVVEKGRLLGIVTFSDFLHAVLRDDQKRTSQEHFIAPCAAYMAESICRMAPEQSIARAFQCFSQYATPTLLVVESDTPVGILSHKDLLAAMHGSSDVEALLASPLGEFMSRELVCIRGEKNVEEAASLLRNERVHQVVVELEDAPAGLLGNSEILQAVGDLRLQTPLREFMSTIVFSIDAQESIKSARRYLRQADISGLVVHDGTWPVGIFGHPEALASLSTVQEERVESVMCSKIICLPEELPACRAAEQGAALGARHIIVQRGGNTVGLATATDFAGLLARATSAPPPAQP